MQEELQTANEYFNKRDAEEIVKDFNREIAALRCGEGGSLLQAYKIQLRQRRQKLRRPARKSFEYTGNALCGGIQAERNCD